MVTSHGRARLTEWVSLFWRVNRHAPFATHIVSQSTTRDVWFLYPLYCCWTSLHPNPSKDKHKVWAKLVAIHLISVPWTFLGPISEDYPRFHWTVTTSLPPPELSVSCIRGPLNNTRIAGLRSDDMAAIQLDFTFRNIETCRTVYSQGSWDTYAAQLSLLGDASEPRLWKRSFQFPSEISKGFSRYRQYVCLLSVESPWHAWPILFWYICHLSNHWAWLWCPLICLTVGRYMQGPQNLLNNSASLVVMTYRSLQSVIFLSKTLSAGIKTD